MSGDPATALDALSALAPEEQIRAAARRLRGDRRGPLAHLEVASELTPSRSAIDGRLLEALCARALAGVPGAVFTAEPEAVLLAAFGLAAAAARRNGPGPAEAVAMLLGEERPSPRLTAALEGLRVLDPACGGGALLAAAERLARRCGARLALHGIEIAPLAGRACTARLRLIGAAARVRPGDATTCRWPAADLVLANPPFVRHEALAREAKSAAARASGLSRQADLSAHFSALALRRAPVAALVCPRALFTARSAAPLLAEARARGGFWLRLRSRLAGSFAASVDTVLVVWVEGAPERPAAEASAPLGELSAAELSALARGTSTHRVRVDVHGEAAHAPRGAVRVGDLCAVRFGLKSGCNAFFHLRPLGERRFASALAGEVDLAASDVVPLLATLKEARAPEVAATTRVLFRPSRPSPMALRYVAVGEELGVQRRPTCASRSLWWLLAPSRPPAPVLYPAKVCARAFGFLNREGLYEDKKWHALFPREIEAWRLALLLSATPVRLAVDIAARQLTGAQAIADVDCRILAAAPFPSPAALAPLTRELERCRAALARDPVTTDVAAMLERPAQRELDLLAGRALGMSPSEVQRARRELIARVRFRLEHAAQVRDAVARRGAAP